jgi:atypical dual specificity phosphatase
VLGLRLHDLLCGLGLRTDPGSWVIRDQVLACAYPRGESALERLASAGVRVIVNLHPRRHDPAVLAALGLNEVHLPTPDFTAPSIEALRVGVAAIEDAMRAGQRVAVHCGGGRGRTGVLLACLLVSRGSSPEDAIREVRERRAGAIETRAQERAVHDFANH